MTREREIKALQLEIKRIKLHMAEYRALVRQLQVRGMEVTERLCKLKEEEKG
jgi:hypothetical protein